MVIETRIGSVMYRGLEFSEPGSLNRWIGRTYTGNRIYVADMFNGRVSIFQFLGAQQ